MAVWEAYLLLLCQRTDKPPYLHVIEAGVYPEREPSPMTPWDMYLFMAEATGANFEEARENVIRKAKVLWGDAWVQGILGAGIGVIR